jgi:FkbM family methyltransferase
VFFVQIGSNDARANDALAMHIDQHRGWRGILVEPIPATFVHLQERRSDPRFELRQAAVTDHDGSIMMYVIRSETIGHASQLATVDKALALSHRQNIEDFAMQTVEVPAVTFATLTRGVADIDVLHIDAEGHDAQILSQVDFNRWTMSAVLYEHVHLTDVVCASTVASLRDHGFKTWSNESDTLCLR